MKSPRHLFVSYAKADVSLNEEERLLQLAEIARTMPQSSAAVFIDELHNYAVGTAL